MILTKRFLFISIFIILNILCIMFIYGRYKSDIVEGIQILSTHIKAMPYSPIWMSLLVALCSIPPMFGFSFSLTLVGYMYGIPSGCLPATIGAFLGSIVSLILIREFNWAKWIKVSEDKQEKFRAIENAIGQGGFKMIVLLRICPIPWQLLNLLLSLCATVDYKSYILSAMIASFKVNLEVWIGSRLANLSDPTLPPETHRWTLISMFAGLFLLAAITFWIYKLTLKIVKESEAELLIENDQQEGISSRVLNKKRVDYNTINVVVV
ncbi:MAG: hypothetical protein EXX96DRAFT_518979 [Benjaminiella poitrasii]|nr:MAG: hypothetical protein EXX96DRAFT_518979 [Benjaminiella poitrasii]